MLLFYSSICLLACSVSDEKSEVILISVPLYVISFSSLLAAFKIFSLSKKKKDFLFITGFSYLIMIFLGVVVLCLFILGFIEFLGSVSLEFSSNSGTFQPVSSPSELYSLIFSHWSLDLCDVFSFSVLQVV